MTTHGAKEPSPENWEIARLVLTEQGYPMLYAPRLHQAVACALDARQRTADASLISALRLIENINNGPDRASGEWRCNEAAQIARDALKKISTL